jgi:ubiquitin-protein ligase
MQMQQRIEKELEELAKMQEASISIKKNVDQTKLELKNNLGNLKE